MKNYIVSHWRGEQRLWVSFWVNGLALYIIATGALVLMGQAINLHVSLGLLIVTCLLIWQITGIVRCSINRIRGDGSVLGKAMGVAAIVVMVAVVYLSATDLGHFASIGQ